jgi:uncharacterized protein DUF3667
VTVPRAPCESCGSTTEGPFCSACGERRLRSDEYSLRRLALDGLRDAFSLDAKLWKSFHNLFVRPGALTVAYMTGSRAGLLGPLQIFLVANLVYFFVQPYTGYTGFNTPLESHLSRQFYSGAPGLRQIVLRDIEERVEARATTELSSLPAPTPSDALAVRERARAIENELYPIQFDASGEVYARSLVVLVIPMLAIAVSILFAGSAVPVVQHVVFSIHLVAWQLVFVMSIFLPLLGLAAAGGMALIGTYLGVPTTQVYADPSWGRAIYLLLEHGATIVETPYFYLALRRAYGGGVLAACLRSAALLLALFGATVVFRFAIFWLTYLAM